MERLGRPGKIETSPEISNVMGNIENLQLAEGVPAKMQPLLDHLKASIGKTKDDLLGAGKDLFIAGPEWCRENSSLAGEAHAEVILGAYGNTYALPNKDPLANRQALNEGNLDMFLMFEKAGMKPIGTACMVLDGGLAELGRAASLGRVGNRLIQDLRIIRWLAEPQLANRIHSLFATLRTAPDRNIAAADRPEIMRGGQAVSHIWAEIPSVRIAGFGPLYKKHGALEQFSFALITQKDLIIPEKIWVQDDVDADFISRWLEAHQLPVLEILDNGGLSAGDRLNIQFAPMESGITKLVHGEIKTDPCGNFTLGEAIDQLETVEVPFIQFPVPIDHNTLELQRELRSRGFQAFQFTPGLEGIQGPLLWFGRVAAGIPIVPTFWEKNPVDNPFWKGKLADHADRISRGW